jgi:hypothetical protein
MPLLTANSLGQFCREISIQLSPLETLLEEWGLTVPEFDRLRTTKGYQDEMIVITQEMAALGPDAGYVYRMKALSEIFIEDVVKIMKAVDTSTGTKVELIKFCAEMARLKEKPPAQQAVDNRLRGPSVIFHFGQGLPIQSMTVTPEPIDVQAIEAPRGFQYE